MSFANYVGSPQFHLLREDVYPQLNPVTMEDVVLHLPPDIDRLAKAFENENLKDLQHELKSPGRPNDKKVGKKLSDLSAQTRADLIKKEILKLDGRQLFVTGGFIRDFVINHYHQIAHEPGDIDLATDASPEALKLIIHQGKRDGILPEDVEVHEIKGAFHNMMIVYGKNKYEMSSFPFVNYEKAPRMYLRSTQQNFTANALYYSPKDKKIYDFHGGLADARRQVARPIGDAKKKLRENPLYPLQLVRLHTMMNRAGSDGIEEQIKKEIGNLSMPRDVDSKAVRNEFMRGLKGALDKNNYIRILGDLGLLRQIFRGLKVNPYPKVGDAKIPAVVMAQILEPNSPDFGSVREHLVNLGYPSTEANSVAFLLKLPYYGPHNEQDFAEERLKNGISTKTVEEFIKLNALKNAKWLRSKLLGDNFPRMIPQSDTAQGQQSGSDQETTGGFLKMINKLHGRDSGAPVAKTI